jgi:hypothetical protein
MRQADEYGFNDISITVVPAMDATIVSWEENAVAFCKVPGTDMLLDQTNGLNICLPV